MLAAPLGPPSVASGLITPFCHRNGRHVPEDGSPRALKPQKSSLFGSEVGVSASPMAWIQSLLLKAILFGPPSPGLPMSKLNPLNHKTACCVPSGGLAV